MFGERSRHDQGQLALLDATIFFAAAILLSSILMSFPPASSDGDPSRSPRVDANEVLVAFLHASISVRFEIVLDEPLAVTGAESFALCLSLEASVILSGGSAEPFQALNDIVREALLKLSPSGFAPSIIVTDKNRGLDDPLLAIPGAVERSNEIYAGSAWIPSSTGDELLVVLMLAPAFPAELAGI